MEIKILHLLEGAQQAVGLTVIIDVFRAFSTACYATGKGAGPLYPAGTLEEAFLMKQQLPGALLMGERNEKKPEGFDLGNSPYQLMKADVSGKAIIHTTSSGTRGIAGASRADEILTGSFVNAGAIVRYIQESNPERVSLVCMGYACLYPTDEDSLCAEYILNELTGKASDLTAMKNQIRQGSGARFFEETSREWAPAEDFDLCLRHSLFDFILKVGKKGPYTYLRRIDI